MAEKGEDFVEVAEPEPSATRESYVWEGDRGPKGGGCLPGRAGATGFGDET